MGGIVLVSGAVETRLEKSERVEMAQSTQEVSDCTEEESIEGNRIVDSEMW